VKRWWLVIILLLSLGTNIGILATQAVGKLARPGQPEAVRPLAPGKLQLFADRLGLEGPARRAFVERHRRFMRETSGPRKRLAELRAQVRTELTAEQPNRERLNNLMQEAASLFLQLERSLTDLVMESRATLPPEAERRYVDLLGRLKLEGPGNYGRLPPPLWQWFRTGGNAPRGAPEAKPTAGTGAPEGPTTTPPSR
jgi:Heavy-metal resistance